jgi:hypothetical protein
MIFMSQVSRLGCLGTVLYERGHARMLHRGLRPRAMSAFGAVRAKLLAPVCGRFPEGFDTLDVQEGKRLLDELA